MGNEQGSPYLQQKQQQQQSTPNSGASTSPYDFESLIVIRGERQTGKTTLVSRMKGQNFNPTYTPTPSLEVFQFPWKLNSSHCNNVMISVWDVVEHSIAQPNNDSNPSTPPADAQTIDTLKRANGLVILIDSRKETSIDLAEKIICEAPEECQIVVFSNFYGENNVSPVIPKKLRGHVGRFSFILGNLRNNLGLVELSKWLQLPLLSAKRKMFADLFRATDNDLHSLEDVFIENSKAFLSKSSALEKIPKGKPNVNYYASIEENLNSDIHNCRSNISPSTSVAPQPTKLERPSVWAEPIQPRKRKPMPFCNNTGSSFDGNENKKVDDVDENDFWSESENDTNDVLDVVPQSKRNNLRPNPMVQAAQPKKTMKQIIEENTVVVVNSNDNSNNSNNSVNAQKLKKRKKKVNHATVQNNDDDHFFSDDDDNGDLDQQQKSVDNKVADEAAINEKALDEKSIDQETLENKNLDDKAVDDEVLDEKTNAAPVVEPVKSKTIFTTTLVIEEEDEEDEEDNKADQQNQKDEPNKVPQITNASNTPNEDEFWSENDEEGNKENINEEMNEIKLNENENDDESLIKPNPLVQKVKPRSNPYQNIVVTPKTQDQPIPSEKPVQNEANIQNDQISTEKVSQESKPAPVTQPNTPQQNSREASHSTNNDDDDFWNFEPVSNQKVIADAIQKKKLMKKHKTEKVPQKTKERPLVIPKSQVAQRTITVGSNNVMSYEQQQKNQQILQQQNPVIPTTDLFSDINDSKNDDFFGTQQKLPVKSSAPIQSSQKVDQSKTKTVRKRKRVVKTATSKNDQDSVPGYDSM